MFPVSEAMLSGGEPAAHWRRDGVPVVKAHGGVAQLKGETQLTKRKRWKMFTWFDVTAPYPLGTPIPCCQ
jgi:hypothetical protein